MTSIYVSESIVDCVESHLKMKGESSNPISIKTSIKSFAHNILVELGLLHIITKLYLWNVVVDGNVEYSGDIIDWRNKKQKELNLYLLEYPKVSDYEGIIRHELYHIVDELEEEFRYDEIDVPIDKLYYLLIWNIYIDSRIIKSGKKTPYSKEKRLKEFKETLKHLENPDEVFEKIWNRNKWSSLK